MFQFSPLASAPLCIQRGMTAHDGCRVSPFGHLRITAYVRLPEAFRSLSRPSSPVRAKASTVRPFPLDRICSHAHKPQGKPSGPCAWHSGTPPKVLFLSLCYSLLPFTRVFKQSARGLQPAAEPFKLTARLAS